jgi:putative effector of murein hydrolase LrgA (UPF0299 family)
VALFFLVVGFQQRRQVLWRCEQLVAHLELVPAVVGVVKWVSVVGQVWSCMQRWVRSSGCGQVGVVEQVWLSGCGQVGVVERVWSGGCG